MKHFIFGILAATTFAVGSAQAGLWTMLQSWSDETKNATSAYNVEVYGHNARVYEWTPAKNENVRCVFVAAESSSGTACYEISDKFKEKND